MAHPDFFGEDGGRSSHYSDLENQWLQVVGYDEDTGDQNGKPSALPKPFPYTQRIIITSIACSQPQSTDSHTDMLIERFAIRTIDIYESPIDNIIFNEPSSPNF